MPMSSAITSKTGSLAVNLFHMRNGKIVDRREFFWEDLPELLESIAREPGRAGERRWIRTGRRRAVFDAGPVFSALLKQLYIDQQYVPRIDSGAGGL